MAAESRRNCRYNLRPRNISKKINAQNVLNERKLKQTIRKIQAKCVLLHDSTSLGLMPFGVLTSFLDFLDEMSLVQLAMTCKFFENLILGECEEATKVWTERCYRLWLDKLYVPKVFKDSPSASSYFLSIQDSKRSHFTSAEELDMQNFHFRFKPTAGEFWIERDSSFMGAPPMFRKLQKDGSICRKVEEFSFDTAPNPLPRPPPPRFDIFDFTEVAENFPHIHWRFTKYCNGSKGQFIKINNFPSLHIIRLKNWGWRLDNIWTTYQSCDDETLQGKF